MPCEMCGKAAEDTQLFFTKVEETILKLCKGCSDYGTVLKPVATAPSASLARAYSDRREKAPEPEEMVVSDYSARIKAAREKRGLSQEQFASALNEKESIIHKIETSHMEPSLKLAQKLESFLGITLIEEVAYQDHQNHSSPKGSSEMTLGDMIKIKKK